MSKSEMKPLEAEKAVPPEEALNEDILKGVIVDGVGLSLTDDYVIIDGYIAPPRSKRDLIAVRMLIVPDALPLIQKWIGDAIKFYEKKFERKLDRKIKFLEKETKGSKR